MNLNFTFGIVTDGKNDPRVKQVIETIDQEKIPSYQIVVVGTSLIRHPRTTVVAFNEATKAMWITKKKNLITQNAIFENVVYMHDYIGLQPGWYEGFKKFGDDFDICQTPMLNYNHTRYRDWSLWAGDSPKLGLDSMSNMIPYDIGHLTKYQYVSGAYWVAKKKVMERFPLDETRGWGEGEDVEWSMRFRDQVRLTLNPHSVVKLLKPGKVNVFREVTPEEADRLRATKI